MECRPLDITVASATDLKNVNLMTKMDVYAVVSINGEPSTSQKTPVHKDSGPNPKWNHRMRFTVDESALQQDRLFLLFKLKSHRPLGDRDIGEVRIPIKHLLNAKPDQVAGYAVMTPNGKLKGTLNFSYRFGDKVSAPAVDHYKHVGNAPYTSAYPYPQPPQSAEVPYAYPPQGYATYPPPPATYGYPAYPPQSGYGYPSGMQKPKRNGGMGGGLGLGLAGGLLGGLLVGDMVSDAAESAAYMDGFEDGADYDF